MTLRDAIQLFRADLARNFALQEIEWTPWQALRAAWSPGIVGVFLLRIGNWLHAKRWLVTARLVERLITLVTRNELQMGCRIGPGLVLPDAGIVGISSFAHIGSNCTFHAFSAIIIPPPASGTEYLIGDHCTIGRRVRIYGPISLAEGTQVKDGSVVLISSKRPGVVLSGVPARRRSAVTLDVIRAWNPRKGCPLNTASQAGAP
ncbi:MAG TPA: hypothetical protein VGM74_11225 [Burkholderiaceae bacterium]